MSNQAVFLFDLTQDVAACRPLALFASREFAAPISLIVSAEFRRRDASGLWYAELQELAAELRAELIEVAGVPETVRALAGRRGMLVSSSESALNPHAFGHGVFLASPPGLTRVTLQHGFECIGFNHNAAHDRTWSRYVGLGCDIAASWFEPDALHSVRPDQRAKVMAVGPSFALDHPMPAVPPRPRRRHGGARAPALHGLVCENLHSVRFAAGTQVAFVDALQGFADALNALGGTIELRPHPAGRYLVKRPVALPDNVRINRLPLYKQALERFGFGLSSPSTVVLDMVWAGIPVAVWTGGDPDLDIGIYNGLHVVSSPGDWLDFAQAASADPMPFLTRQFDYLRALPIPRDVAGRYRALVATAAGLGDGAVASWPRPAWEPVAEEDAARAEA